MAHKGKYLQSLSPLPKSQAKMPCVVLAHNELLIFPDFLRHYREIGVDRFLIVDDRSTDGSVEFLHNQADVTIFSPVEGSTYQKDKRFWRAELLDTYCSCKWVVVPDVDEHLVYKGIDEGSDLFALARTLEDEGAGALHAVMLDMYCDMPLQDHQFRAGRLIDEFPMFDGPDYYFRIAAPPRFRKKYPTPFAFAVGGMRQRLFEPLSGKNSSYLILKRFGDISGEFSPKTLEQVFLNLIRFFSSRFLKLTQVYNCSKIPFLKWENGIFFYGGAHALSKKVVLSRKNAVVLHFKFASGVDGLNYVAQRGQHAGGSELYKRLLRQTEVLSASPVFEGSKSYTDSTSLGRFLT